MVSLLELAQQELENNRRYYDSQFGELILGRGLLNNLPADFFSFYPWVEPFDYDSAMGNLLEAEMRTEQAIRRDAINMYIREQGLSQHEKEIILGMNQTARRVTIHHESQFTNLLVYRAVLLHDSFALLDFAFSYVNRWQNYHNLAKQGWGSESYKSDYRDSLEMLSDMNSKK
jgi:hypothetical protein